MPNRDRDWFNQAVRDLEQAQDSRRAGRHEWACFAAQQAGEKAVKALHLHLAEEAWGYWISLSVSAGCLVYPLAAPAGVPFG